MSHAREGTVSHRNCLHLALSPLSSNRSSHLTHRHREKRFGASQNWLIQQVARLHDRFDSRVRETIAAAKTAPPKVQPPLPASDSGTPMARTGSGQGQPGRPRAPSQLSIRNTAIRNDGSLPTTPRGGTGPSSTFAATPRLQASRGPSGGTPAQVGGPGSAAGSLRLRTGVQSSKPRFSSLNDAGPSTPTPQTASPTSDHTSGSDESPIPAQSRIIHPPYFQSNTGNLDDAGMEEDEPQAAFLPYESNPPSEKDDASEGSGERYSDPSATLRGEPHVFAANATRRLQNVTDTTQVLGKGKGKERERLRHRSGLSDSSGGSDHKRHIQHHRTPINPLSPLRTAKLKGKAVSRDASDGAPSMGSSFDDLDGKPILPLHFHASWCGCFQPWSVMVHGWISVRYANMFVISTWLNNPVSFGGSNGKQDARWQFYKHHKHAQKSILAIVNPGHA